MESNFNELIDELKTYDNRSGKFLTSVFTFMNDNCHGPPNLNDFLDAESDFSFKERKVDDPVEQERLNAEIKINCRTVCYVLIIFQVLWLYDVSGNKGISMKEYFINLTKNDKLFDMDDNNIYQIMDLLSSTMPNLQTEFDKINSTPLNEATISM